MPFALIIVGVVLLTASVKNTQGDLYTLVKGDFTGSNNYLYWLVSILIIGAVGYIPTLKSLSRVFLVLVIVVLFLTHGGVFQQFNSQLFSSNSTVSNMPINLGGITGNFTGDLNTLQQWLQQWPQGIEQPLVSPRPSQQ